MSTGGSDQILVSKVHSIALRQPRALGVLVERVRAVTKEAVLEAARKYMRPDNIQVVFLGEEAFEID